MMSNKDIKILDCTLRDGGYPIHFQFSCRDVKNICLHLEESGIPYIEVGHGLGLGASGHVHGIAFETDADYINAAKQVTSNALVGCFFIPEIGTGQDLELAVECGIDFIRIGVEVTEVEKAIPWVSLAKDLHLEVHVNMMKTYALSEKEMHSISRILSGTSLDVLYIVDSAGCMTPDMVSSYVKQFSNEDFQIGFHGHNNLNLANANCLAAIDAGATFIDGTLGGMGRSAGNAQTEVIAFLVDDKQNTTNYNTSNLFEATENYLNPLRNKAQGLNPLDVIVGMSRFHTSHLPRFKRMVSKYDINLYQLICERTRSDSRLQITSRNKPLTVTRKYIPVLIDKVGAYRCYAALYDYAMKAFYLRL